MLKITDPAYGANRPGSDFDLSYWRIIVDGRELSPAEKSATLWRPGSGGTWELVESRPYYMEDLNAARANTQSEILENGMILRTTAADGSRTAVPGPFFEYRTMEQLTDAERRAFLEAIARADGQAPINWGFQTDAAGNLTQAAQTTVNAIQAITAKAGASTVDPLDPDQQVVTTYGVPKVIRREPPPVPAPSSPKPIVNPGGPPTQGPGATSTSGAAGSIPPTMLYVAAGVGLLFLFAMRRG